MALKASRSAPVGLSPKSRVRARQAHRHDLGVQLVPLGGRVGGGHHRVSAVLDEDHALATGFSHGYPVSAAIGLLALIITLATIRVTRQDLSGVDPMAAPVG